MAEFAIRSSDRELMQNAVINRFVNTTVDLLKLECLQTLGSQVNPEAFRFRLSEARGQQGLQSLVARRFESLHASVRPAVVRSLRSDRSVLRLAENYRVDLRSDRPVLDQVDLRAIYDFLPQDPQALGGKDAPPISWDRDILADGLKPVLDEPIIEPPPERPGIRAVQFRAHKVTAVNETGADWMGSDEIAWGGATLDDDGTAGIIPETFIGKFDTGDSQTYKPEILWTSLVHGGWKNKPVHMFTLTLTLAEKDNGGFSDFITETYNKVKADVLKILTACGVAAGAYLGAQIGGTLGATIAGPLGAALGAIFGAIVGALIAWIANLLKDDIFVPQTAVLLLTNPYHFFPNGKSESPDDTQVFLLADGSDGKYEVVVDWELIF